jgi:hypothetical protein
MSRTKYQSGASKPATASATASTSSGELYRLYDKLDRLEELLEDMADLGVTSTADAERLIGELNDQIDALEAHDRGEG